VTLIVRRLGRLGRLGRLRLGAAVDALVSDVVERLEVLS
jgi:hypothetical protein